MKKLSFIFLFLFAANVLAQSVVDIDVDDDGLIEINHLEDLNAMRYQLDGSGLRANATAQKITTGCAVGGCKGYELTRDLDFFAAASYRNIANQKLWTTGAGWQPIGDAKHPFSSLFKTNNSSIPNTIFNLTINNSSASKVGLFGHINNTAEISGIGLLDVEVTGHHQVGGLVGESSGGQISNSYVSGRVVGYGGEVGLLVGRNSGAITNSFSDGEVSGEANGSGGLVGANSGAIANSYATGNVVGSANYVGGLVGDNSQGTISNCYTTGTVSGGEDIGGLVGISNLGTLINNYVSGKSSGTRYVGGLVGSNIGGTITHSYWDKTASEIESNTGGVGLSASELQSANAQAEDLNKPYYKWSESNWDFGTAEQYPVLKYAVGPNSDNPVCGAEQTLPNCGTLLLGQHASLSRIVFLEDIALAPIFKPTQLNYHLNITADIKQLQLIPVASKPDSTIKVSKNGIAIDNTLASGTTSSVITLTQNTEITIEVSATNQRPAQYRLAINYIPTVAIVGIPPTAIDEGKTITLDASKSHDTEGDTLTYRWTQTIGKTLSIAENDQATLSFKIPEDYVAATAANDPLGFTLTISDGKATIAQDINLTINKIDNGSSAIGTPTLNILEWTAPEIDLSADPDGVGSNLRYQWQSRAPDSDADWTDIDKATKPTHALSFLTIPDTAYRVRISYTDGQGYETTRISAAAKYDTEIVTLNTAQAQAAEPENTPTATTPSITVSTVFQCSTNDIDQDDDGLIEICDLEGLNAIRYQMDGTGYRTSTDTTKITIGCKTGGCNGYELMRDLDFNDDASYSSTANKVIYTVDDYEDSSDNGWQPIGYHANYYNRKSFNSIFEGNGYTISNLTINRPNTNDIGLFGCTESNSKILNIGLVNVDVEGDWPVGGLVGWNDASITNSYATGSVDGNYHVGGLVGWNYSSITNSYATGSVNGEENVGGLVGWNYSWNYSSITNSYATGSVDGDYSVGGLIGWNVGSITNSYATGSVNGEEDVGGLVGFSAGNIKNSYWDTKESRILTSAGGIGKTTVALQSPTAATGIYSNWNADNWDFGTASQYPVLKYATACGASGQPDCGALLPTQYPSFLDDLKVVSPKNANISPKFNPQTLNYRLAVNHNIDEITLHTTATGASIRISNDTAGTEPNAKDLENVQISLTITGDTVITIEVSKGNQRLTQYTLTVAHTVGNSSSTIAYVDNDEVKDIPAAGITIDEGSKLELSFNGGGCNLRCEWHVPSYPSLSSAISATQLGENSLSFEIPHDVVEASQSSRKLEVIFAKRDDSGIARKAITLIVKKEDNDDIDLGQISLADSTLISPKIDLSTDADRGGKADTLSYQWQQYKGGNLDLNEATNWIDISGATTKTYTLATGALYVPRHRLQISYTDGQNHEEELYTDPIRDIDMDNDGLIEIRYLEELDAIRYQMDGTGYRASADTNEITAGCKSGGCNGYELVRDLDFNDDASYSSTANKVVWMTNNGWQPIGYYTNNDDNEPFTSIFEGNGHAISNLMINRPNTSYVGLFSYTAKNSKILNIGLLNVDIEAKTRVGGLVGRNGGSVTSSYAIGSVSGKNNVGGLAGSNVRSSITNSYATSSVSGKNNVGGLAGENWKGRITNSYATGPVGGDNNVGGLTGNSWRGRITNSYAMGSVNGDNNVGGLVGRNQSTITNSYWDTDESGISTSSGGIGKTTIQLQSPTTATGIYSKWGTVNWDFGTASQYPALKYATACDAAGQPECGALLPSEYTFLDDLVLSSKNTNLLTKFNPQTLNYRVAVNYDVDKVTLHTTATGAFIRISTDTAGTEPNDKKDAVSVPISLTITGDTVITIEVGKGNQRLTTQYTLTVAHNTGKPSSTIPTAIAHIGTERKDIPAAGLTIKEGEELKLIFNNVVGEWRVPSALSEAKLSQNSLSFNIPHDFIEASQSSRKLAVIFAKRDDSGIARTTTTLIVEKEDNDDIDLGQISLAGSTLISPKIDLSTDTDRGGQADTLSYQWQYKGGDLDLNESTTSWINISGATTKTYTIAGGALYAPRYRLHISYTDGQDHQEDLYTDPTDPIRNIDLDDDGLIEIRYLEELDAIRYQLDGSGYKASAGAAKIMTGCKSGGCNGYELVRDLDFNDDASYSSTANKVIWTTGEGWNPIVGTTESLESFSGTFRGNNHTIANLMINRETDDIGLFAKISDGAVIDGVDLYKVNIRGKYRVGALVSSNRGGTITNISIDGEVNGSGDYIGGLVGVNGPSSKIANSYSAANVRGVEKGMGKFVGGLVGTSLGKISDSYAMGNTTGNLYVGGLVGLHESGATTKSYAIAKVRGKAMVGGLIGHKRGGSDIQDSYWDTRASGISTSADGSSKTTVELQMPTMATGIYSKWSADNWDFGTTKQYPALKYNSDECAGDAAPDYCGDLLAGQRLGLQSLELSDGAMLLSDFSNTTYRYDVLVGNKEKIMRLTAIAANLKNKVRLNKGGREEQSIGTIDSEIELAADNSTMTIVVGEGRSRVTYTLNMIRFEVGIEVSKTIYNEGETIYLKPDFHEIMSLDPYTYSWTQSPGKTLITTTTTEKIKPIIPGDFVAGDDLSSAATLNLEVTANRGNKQIKSDIDVNLTINKANNGSVPEPVEALTLMGLTLTATFPTKSHEEAEPDGGINTNNIHYRWQSFNPDTEKWDNIKNNADQSNHELLATTPTAYRVHITYRDEQGYSQTVVSQSRTYIGIDRDDNGLIDISTKEQLNAIRYRLNDTGYRTSTATKPITAGCATNDKGDEVCKGYELKAHIDLSPNATVGVGSYEKWQPIGDGKNPFDTIFEGNDYTISNLRVNEPDSNNVGLFAATAANAKILNVGLLNVVEITGNNNIGSIVGSNKGTIKNSYVIAKNIIGKDNVGGLVGYNEGSITNNYIIAKYITSNSNIGGLVGNSILSKVEGNYAKIDTMKSGDNTVCFLVQNTKQVADNKMIGDCENKKIFQ